MMSSYLLWNIPVISIYIVRRPLSLLISDD